MQQDGEGVQEVVIAALKDVHHTDQAATHVPPHLNLCTSNNTLNRPVCDLSGAYSRLQPCMATGAPSVQVTQMHGWESLLALSFLLHEVLEVMLPG